jgi:hypothetical protein
MKELLFIRIKLLIISKVKIIIKIKIKGKVIDRKIR